MHAAQSANSATAALLMPPPPGAAAELDLPATGIVQALPPELYHAAAGVSQSALKVFRKSPFHYHARFELPIPDVFNETDDDQGSAVMFAGTLCHCATLEPGAFETRYAVGPKVKTRAAKAWKEFVEAHPERVAITPRQAAIARAQAAALRQVDAVAEILDGGQCEVSAFWLDPVTGLQCRARPDCVNREFGSVDAPQAMILDVKSTADASLRAVQATIARYGYHHQAEWYCRGYTAASGVAVAGFVFAFVEQDYPFAVRVVELDAEAMEIAARENREALDELARCRAARAWPGYAEDVGVIALPRWAGGRGDY